MDKQELKCNAQLRLNYFSVNVSVLAVVFRRHISNTNIFAWNCRFFESVGGMQTHISWNFDHISRTYNQINYSNIWFAKVIIILIKRVQVFSSMFFSKKPRTWMSLSLNLTLHKKWSFPLRVSSVNVTKSAANYRFGHTYWRNP